jgi:aconitate hydratase
MSPEYGATMGFFPVDEQTCSYLAATGRSSAQVDSCGATSRPKACSGMPAAGAIEYSTLLDLDLGSVQSSVAGPKRPQDRISLQDLGARFRELLQKSTLESGYGKAATDMGRRAAATIAARGNGGTATVELGDGDIVIAAITSCTNTSNPSVMLAAGLLAKKAVERG